jgi:hypothetical protein
MFSPFAPLPMFRI